MTSHTRDALDISSQYDAVRLHFDDAKGGMAKELGAAPTANNAEVLVRAELEYLTKFKGLAGEKVRWWAQNDAPWAVICRKLHFKYLCDMVVILHNSTVYNGIVNEELTVSQLFVETADNTIAVASRIFQEVYTFKVACVL